MSPKKQGGIQIAQKKQGGPRPTPHFSYAESAKAALLGAKGMCYGSGISLLSKSVLSSIEVRESPNFLMRERS